MDSPVLCHRPEPNCSLVLHHLDRGAPGDPVPHPAGWSHLLRSRPCRISRTPRRSLYGSRGVLQLAVRLRLHIFLLLRWRPWRRLPLDGSRLCGRRCQDAQNHWRHDPLQHVALRHGQYQYKLQAQVPRRSLRRGARLVLDGALPLEPHRLCRRHDGGDRKVPLHAQPLVPWQLRVLGCHYPRQLPDCLSLQRQYDCQSRHARLQWVTIRLHELALRVVHVFLQIPERRLRWREERVVPTLQREHDREARPGLYCHDRLQHLARWFR